ncbi:MAG: DUF1826 domain-containing protein [Pseudomonadota bacterium]
MTAALKTDIAPSVEGETASVLSRILDPSTSLAIWRRALSRSLQDAAVDGCASVLQHASAFHSFGQTEVDCFYDALTRDAGASITPIAEDLVALAKVFADICGAVPVRVRVETIADNGCRRFHFDNVAMRLVVTYRGPGTQWVPPEFAANAYAQQTEYNGPINEIRTGDVALFRGRRSSVVGMTLHRSPPLLKNAPPRLIGVIDYEGREIR